MASNKNIKKSEVIIDKEKIEKQQKIENEKEKIKSSVKKVLKSKTLNTKEEYDKMINKYVLSCWFIISLLLFCLNFLEYRNGDMDRNYFIAFVVFDFVPLFFCFIMRYFIGKANNKNKNFVTYGYLLFYIFCLFTSKNIFVFSYILPMFCVFVVYGEKDVLRNTSLITVFVNFLSIFRFFVNSKFTNVCIELSSMETFSCFLTQILIVSLSGTFLYYGSKKLIERDKLLKKLSEEIYIDKMTGLYNKKFFMERVPVLFNNDLNFSVAFIDVDNFKQFNDNYGHEIGDKVLINITSILLNKMKNIEDTYCIRVGGDEFVIMTKSDGYEKFYLSLNEAKQEVFDNKIVIEDGQEIKYHISVGVANSIFDNCTDYSELCKLADQKLYDAKSKGKNAITR